MEVEIYADGGARGNPGPAAVGIVVLDKKNNQILEKIGQFVGENLTNNQAEYQAVIKALNVAQKYSPDQVTVFLDAKLLVEQLNGRFRVKNPKLRTYFDQVLDLKRALPVVEFKHIPREKNKLADNLVNEVLDECQI